MSKFQKCFLVTGIINYILMFIFVILYTDYTRCISECCGEVGDAVYNPDDQTVIIFNDNNPCDTNQTLLDNCTNSCDKQYPDNQSLLKRFYVTGMLFILSVFVLCGVLLFRLKNEKKKQEENQKLLG